MQASEVPRAVSAATSTASALDLRVDDAIVLQDSNRLAVRLLPCDVLARVADVAHQAGAEFEVEIARRLAETDSPVAALHLAGPLIETTPNKVRSVARAFVSEIEDKGWFNDRAFWSGYLDSLAAARF